MNNKNKSAQDKSKSGKGFSIGDAMFNMKGLVSDY